MKYEIPVGKSSHGNKINYSFNKLFNTLRMWSVMNCICFVLCLNESSTEEDMKKAYCSLDRQFHHEKKKHSQFTDVMQMINEAKE